MYKKFSIVLKVFNHPFKDIRTMFLTLFAVLAICMPANCLTLNGSIEYTVESARAEAFKDVEKTIPVSDFSKYVTDIFYFSSIDFINGKISESVGRKIVPFYAKNKKLLFYGVQYNGSPQKFYYSPEGRLLKYEVNTFKGTYPYKTAAYDTKGRLLNINLIISQNESYIFDRNEKSIGHWLGNKFYNSNGKEDITRIKN